VASSFVATAGEMPPRRRDRRRPRDPSPPSSDARAPPSASGLRLTLLVPLLLLVLVLAALGFSGLLSRSPPHSRTLQTTAHSVYERGLVKRDVSAREILAVSISRSYCSIQSFVVIAELLARVATDAVPPPPPCCWTTWCRRAVCRSTQGFPRTGRSATSRTPSSPMWPPGASLLQFRACLWYLPSFVSCSTVALSQYQTTIVL